MQGKMEVYDRSEANNITERETTKTRNRSLVFRNSTVDVIE